MGLDVLYSRLPCDSQDPLITVIHCRIYAGRAQSLELSPRPIRAGPAHGTTLRLPRRPSTCPGARRPRERQRSLPQTQENPHHPQGGWAAVCSDRGGSGTGSGSDLRGAGPPPPNCYPRSPLRRAVSHGLEALRPFCVLGQQVTVRRKHALSIPAPRRLGHPALGAGARGGGNTRLGGSSGLHFPGDSGHSTLPVVRQKKKKSNLELPQRQIPGFLGF